MYLIHLITNSFMKGLFLLLVVSVFVARLFAQKPIVDTSVFGKWPFVYNAKVTFDGKYAGYCIRNFERDSQVFISTKATWKEFLSRCGESDFLSDGKYAVYRTLDDSLYFLQLGTHNHIYIGQASSYSLLRDKQNKEWVIYQDADKNFTIKETSTGKLQFEKNVIRYLFNKTSGALLLQLQEKGRSSKEQLLCWIDLATGDRRIIWKGEQASNYAFDENGSQVAFLAEEQKSVYSIWYYRPGMQQAERWVSSSTAGIDSGLLINNEEPVFSKNGRRLFFKLIEKPTPPASLDAVKVDVWSYKDLNLQEEQLYYSSPDIYLAVLDTEDKRVRRLQLEDEKLNFYLSLKGCDNYVLVTKNGNKPDLWWQKTARSSVYIESVRDSNRTLLKENIPYAHDWFKSLDFSLSPNEKYVIYYDPAENNYFSYDIATKIVRNITQGITTSWKYPDNRWSTPVFGFPIGIAGWLDKEEAVLIYDEFDLWQVDPAGVKKPLNVTNGYGLAHHIQLRLALPINDLESVAPNSLLLLKAFDTLNKYSGFYSKSLQQMGDPSLLSMGPYVYGVPERMENSAIWTVLRQSAVEAPNYFLTRNFRNFTPLSDVQPQRKFNWLTSELLTWSLPDGSQTQGILYKPEDFNAHRKYPLLIHYYEERSQELFQYRTPEPTRDEINIPYFVSRGYLVFIPDIHYKIGAPGESIVNTVTSAARFLCQNSWVDSSRIGLQGHSFGGWETNYLITHTHLFAAAAEGAGSANIISSYGGLFSGQSRQFLSEMYQGRIHYSLWDRPDLYINASPIFKADKVTTPLLMMHNKRDGAVPWAQAVEFFTALRRLGKKVWMLQYDNGTHFVEGKDAIDYTIRMTQFFDHYLKGQPAPRWMTEGIPAKRKGIETKYELEDDLNIVP